MRFVLTLIAGGALALPGSILLAQAAPAPDPSSSQTPAQTQTQTTAPQPAQTPQLKLYDLPKDPHTATPEEKAQQEASERAQKIRQLAIAQNNWGPASSAPGMSISLKEVSRTKTDAGTQITYQIQGTGFTPDMKLSLIRWPLDQNVATVMDGVTVNASGTAVCGGTDAGTCGKTLKANEPVQVSATVAGGEAIRVALVAADKKHGAAVSFVPFPIASEDRGCKLQVIRGSKNDELVLLVGDGFPPTGNFNAGSESFGEKKELGSKPNPQGHLVVAMTPWVPGHDAGDTVVYAQTDTCSPTLSFHWGKDTYKAE